MFWCLSAYPVEKSFLLVLQIYPAGFLINWPSWIQNSDVNSSVLYIDLNWIRFRLGLWLVSGSRLDLYIRILAGKNYPQKRKKKKYYVYWSADVLSGGRRLLIISYNVEVYRYNFFLIFQLQFFLILGHPKHESEFGFTKNLDSDPDSLIQLTRIRNINIFNYYIRYSVPDPWHFGVDPDPDLDPRIHVRMQIRILLFSWLTFTRCHQKTYFFLLITILFEGTCASFLKIKSQKEVTKQ